MAQSRVPRAPRHLGPEAAAFWKATVREYDLPPHDLKVLEALCDAWDRYVGAREALADHGTTYADRFGQPRSRPEVAVERDARLHVEKLARALCLDGDEPASGGCLGTRLRGATEMGRRRRPSKRRTTAELTYMQEVELLCGPSSRGTAFSSPEEREELRRLNGLPVTAAMREREARYDRLRGWGA